MDTDDKIYQIEMLDVSGCRIAQRGKEAILCFYMSSVMVILGRHASRHLVGETANFKIYLHFPKYVVHSYVVRVVSYKGERSGKFNVSSANCRRRTT